VLSGLVIRLRALVRRRAAEDDLAEELRFHLAEETERNVARGMAPAEAALAARRAFGNVTAAQDAARATFTWRWLEDLGQDLRYGARSLTTNKGFAAAVLLIVALGVGANTATFTLVDALILRPLPVPHPGQLVAIGNRARTGSMSTGGPRTDLASYPVYADLRDQNHVLTGLYAQGRTGQLDAVLASTPPGSGGAVEHPRGRFVSGNFFEVLRVPAVLGRTFTGAEDRAPGGDPVVVVSYAYWRRRLGGDRSWVGRTLAVNGVPLTVLGVAPEGFFGDIVGQAPDLWIPLMMQPILQPHAPLLQDRNANWLLLMGRLAPGVTVERARAELQQLDARTILDHASGSTTRLEASVRREPVPVAGGAQGFSYWRSAYAGSLWTIMAAVALVLLLVCANVANLMLARGAARGREVSVRMALGAGRGRLIRQLLTESLLLAGAGAALGLALAVWGSTALLRQASGGPAAIPIDIGLDRRVLVFTAALAIVTGLVFGLAPALRATRLDLASALRTQGRGVMGAARGRGPWPLGKVLVAAQVGISLILLVGTGMLVRSLRRLEGSDIGVDRDRLIIARVDATPGGYTDARLAALMRDLVARAGRVPGVAEASFSASGLFSGSESSTSLQVEGFTARADSDTAVAYDVVGPRYFRTVGARLLRGRDFEASDDESAPKVAILNETMARFFFPGGDAVGRHVLYRDTPFTVVGVVADVNGRDLRTPRLRELYMPVVQMQGLAGGLTMPFGFYLEVRASGDAAPLIVPLERALRAADPSVAVLGVDRLADLVGESVVQDRLVAHVVSFFGVLALMLAAIGLYGVISYAALRRTSEFGLRIALGAEARNVTWMVLGEALLLTAVGVVVGAPLALLGVRILRNQLFGIGLFDPPSLVGAVLVLAASAALAGLIPALRASRVAPLEALRAE
jgi:predicted permease